MSRKRVSTLRLFYGLHASGSKRKQIESSIPTYTHWTTGGEDRTETEKLSQTRRNEEASGSKWPVFLF